MKCECGHAEEEHYTIDRDHEGYTNKHMPCEFCYCGDFKPDIR